MFDALTKTKKKKETAYGLKEQKKPEAVTPPKTDEKAEAVAKPSFSYDPNADQNYLNAIGALEKVQKNKPLFENSFDEQLTDLYDRIVNREKFAYNVDDDALYQQFAADYTRRGEMAMQDTMGKAASLTGGYANSYAQTVGQQAYQAHLTELNNIIPDLYGQALDRYTNEGNDLMNKYALTKAQADDEYAKYTDEYTQWEKDVATAQTNVDKAYDQGYTKFWNEKEAQNAEYEKIMGLVASGYKPSKNELVNAGLNEDQAEFVKTTVEANQTASQSPTSFGEFSPKDFVAQMSEAFTLEDKAMAEALVVAAGYSDAAWEVYHLFFGEKK